MNRDTELDIVANEVQVDAKKYLDETVRLYHGVHRALYHLAERLKIIRDERKWEIGGYTSFDLFLDEEMKISESTASKWISIYEVFKNVSLAKLTEAGGWSNLAEILPIVRKTGEMDKWVDILIEHPREAVRAFIAEAKTGIPQENCRHEWVYMKFCPHCHEKQKVYEEEIKTKEAEILPLETMGTVQADNPISIS